MSKYKLRPELNLSLAHHSNSKVCGDLLTVRAANRIPDALIKTERVRTNRLHGDQRQTDL